MSTMNTPVPPPPHSTRCPIPSVRIQEHARVELLRSIQTVKLAPRETHHQLQLAMHLIEAVEEYLLEEQRLASAPYYIVEVFVQGEWHPFLEGEYVSAEEAQGVAGEADGALCWLAAFADSDIPPTRVRQIER